MSEPSPQYEANGGADPIEGLPFLERLKARAEAGLTDPTALSAEQVVLLCRAVLFFVDED